MREKAVAVKTGCKKSPSIYNLAVSNIIIGQWLMFVGEKVVPECLPHHY